MNEFGQVLNVVPAFFSQKIAVSVFGDVSGHINQCNLGSLKDVLSQDELWSEVALLDKIVYKNRSQHCNGSFMKRLYEVQRLFNLTRHLLLPELLSALAIALETASSSSFHGKSNEYKTVRKLVVHLPPREAAIFILQRLLSGCNILQSLQSALAAAASHLSAQLARCLFMPLCLTLLAIVGRLHSLCTSRVTSSVKVYTSVASLAPLLPPLPTHSSHPKCRVWPLGGRSLEAVSSDGVIVQDFACTSKELILDAVQHMRMQHSQLCNNSSVALSSTVQPETAISHYIDELPCMLTCEWKNGLAVVRKEIAVQGKDWLHIQSIELWDRLGISIVPDLNMQSVPKITVSPLATGNQGTDTARMANNPSGKAAKGGDFNRAQQSESQKAKSNFIKPTSASKVISEAPNRKSFFDLMGKSACFSARTSAAQAQTAVQVFVDKGKAEGHRKTAQQRNTTSSAIEAAAEISSMEQVLAPTYATAFGLALGEEGSAFTLPSTSLRTRESEGTEMPSTFALSPITYPSEHPPAAVPSSDEETDEPSFQQPLPSPVDPTSLQQLELAKPQQDWSALDKGQSRQFTQDPFTAGRTTPNASISYAIPLSCRKISEKKTSFQKVPAVSFIRAVEDTVHLSQKGKRRAEEVFRSIDDGTTSTLALGSKLQKGPKALDLGKGSQRRSSEPAAKLVLHSWDDLLTITPAPSPATFKSAQSTPETAVESQHTSGKGKKVKRY